MDIATSDQSAATFIILDNILSDKNSFYAEWLLAFDPSNPFDHHRFQTKPGKVLTWAPSKSRPLPKPADRNRVVENLNKLFKHLTGDVSTHSSQHLTGRRRADANLSHSSTDWMSKRSRLVAPEGSYKWLLWWKSTKVSYVASRKILHWDLNLRPFPARNKGLL